MTHEPSPYAGTSPVASLGRADGSVTLVEGQTFCLSERSGDMAADLPHGLFVFDTRVVSRWELHVNGHRLEPLNVEIASPFQATFIARSTPAADRADADIVVLRRRHIGYGMREQLEITNYGLEPVPIVVELSCDTDFADLFEVKESRVRRRGQHSHDITATALRFGHRVDDLTKEVTVAVSRAASIEPGSISWRHHLDPRQSWDVCLEVSIRLGRNQVSPRFTCGGRDAESPPARRLASWQAALPTVHTDDPGLSEAMVRSGEDLGALRIFDPDHPESPILAAGAPWFMTVFGRDSLLTAWMTLLADPSLAHGVLETLARFQGTEVDPTTEEEPGKILHEMRFGTAGDLTLGGGHVYYGSNDATPLFVMLLGELRRWDPRDVLVERLLPHADRALAWIEDFGDRDGDGYVEYERTGERGLANQGWKDSWDAIRHTDNRLAPAPIALCEVQGYVYAAYIARAHLAEEAGDRSTQERFSAKARDLRRRFNEDFWLEEQGWYAVGLDGDKRPIAALASNIGHCLWTGIIDTDRADAVAARLMSPEMFSGFGIRTLATTMAAYNPVSYHNGSVWPHDNALCAAGLVRYGFVEEAHRIITSQIAVARADGGRLPELFAGFDRDRVSVPTAYPTSCSPQAWAAAAPLLWLRTLLRLDPWAPRGQVWIDPVLPEGMRRLSVTGIRVAEESLTVSVEGDVVTVNGAGDLEVVRRPRPPQTDLLDPTPDEVGR